MSNLVQINTKNAIAYIGKPVRIRKRLTEDSIFSTLRAFDSAGFLIDTSVGAGFYSSEEYDIKGERIWDTTYVCGIRLQEQKNEQEEI